MKDLVSIFRSKLCYKTIPEKDNPTDGRSDQTDGKKRVISGKRMQ